MSLLVDHQIEKAVESGDLMITPYDAGALQSNSYDLKLGRSFIRFLEVWDPIDPYDQESITGSMLDPVVSPGPVDIRPGELVLAETVESIRLPADIVAAVEGKSSLARLGISIHQTGGWIDAGFFGTITLEIANLNRSPIRLYPGMPIAQIVFYRTEPARVPYSAKPDAKYLGQVGATPSRYYQNTDISQGNGGTVKW